MNHSPTFISCIVDTLCIEAIISESNGGDIPPGQPKTSLFIRCLMFCNHTFIDKNKAKFKESEK